MDASKLSINMNLSEGKCRDYGELDIMTSDAGNLRTCDIDVKATILRHYHAVELTDDRKWALEEILRNADTGWCKGNDYHSTRDVGDIIKDMLAEIAGGEV